MDKQTKRDIFRFKRELLELLLDGEMEGVILATFDPVELEEIKRLLGVKKGIYNGF